MKVGIYLMYCNPTCFQTTCPKVQYFEKGPKRTQSLKICIFGRYLEILFLNPILMRFLFELIMLRASTSMSTDFLYIFQSVFIDVISFFSSKKSKKSKKKSKNKKRKRKYSTESLDSADSGEEEDSELLWVEKSRLK